MKNKIIVLFVLVFAFQFNNAVLGVPQNAEVHQHNKKVLKGDVVEELNLNDGFEATGCHSDRAANDVGFGEGAVEDAVAPELKLESVRSFEDPAFAFEFAEKLGPHIGDVLSKCDDAWVPPHL